MGRIWQSIGAALACAAFPAMATEGRAGEHRCARLRGLLAPAEVAERFRIAEPAERRERLVAVLEQDAAVAAQPVVQALRDARARGVEVIWSAGVVCASAPRAVWPAIEALSEVDGVFADPPHTAAELDDANFGPNRGVAPESPLIALKVPEVWDRGITGQGVVVALIDTGVDMTHPDLVRHIWTNPREVPGNGVDDDGNGFVDDIHGWDFETNDNDPTDTVGHGTNSAGLIVGDGSAGKQTGAAPDASIMVLRRGTTQSSLWQASQYAIRNGATVVSQSSSWKWSFSPRPDYASWRRQADSELAAGVIHANSGGNSGDLQSTEPIPYNVAAPANCPPPWLPPAQNPRAGVSSVLAVGNVDARALEIAVSSPYGPAEWTDIAAHRDATYPYAMPPEYQDYPTWNGGAGLNKPDLVAPGDNSTTTALGGGYETAGGTSAAAPRIAALLALLKQAAPHASPADLARALVGAARDRGPAGYDARFGYGLPDAYGALVALGPTLMVTGTTITDTGTPRGDGDGGADAGEIDQLALTLRNTSTADLAGIDLILTSVSGVTVRDGYARLALVAGSAAVTVPAFSVEFPSGSCGATAQLQLEIRQGGSTRIEEVFLPVGTTTRTTLFADDAEANNGCTVSGNATSGAWVRQVPVGTTKGGQPANPPADNSPNGTFGWVTGNGPTDPDAADVDGGKTILTSPARNATGYAKVELDYARWFFGSSTFGEDDLLIEGSGGGGTWKLLEDVAATENVWRTRHVVLSDLLTPGAATQLRFTTADVGTNDTVEGAIDDVTLTGVALACQPWSFPTTPTPSPVGASLRLSRVTGGHLLLMWSAPSSQGGVDPARGYKVTRSASASTGFAEIGRPIETRFTEIDGLAGIPPVPRFYLVDSLSSSP